MRAIQEFPNVRVIVFNENEPNVEHKWTGDIELQYDGEIYLFKSLEGLEVPPEAAWFLFAFDTRPTDPAEPNSPPWNKRRLTGGGDKRDPSWYENRLVAMGWANDPVKREWFKKFRFKVALGKKTYTREEVAKMK